MPYFDKLDLDPTLFTAAAKPKANEPGDMRRGLTAAFQQIPQLGYGLMAGAGAALETAAGEGGIGTGIKQAGIRGFAEWGDKIAADSKETDSFSTAYNRAKEGDIGALADWLQYGLGYAGGQAVQLLAGAGAGTLAGKALLGTAAEKAAKGMVQKEAARLAAANAAQGGARVGVEDLLKQATKNVAGKIGQTTAVAAQSFGMTGGEIFGGLTADNADRALTGDELAKAFGATLAAGGLEFAADKLGLDLILGKSKLLKPAESITGMKGRAARAGVGALAQMPIEGGTEYLQTGIENYGRGSEASPFTFNQSEESQREAFDAAAMGAVGGGAIGAVGGGFSRATAKRQADADRALDDFKAATDPDAMVDAALRATDVPLDVPPAGGTTDADGVITPRRRSFYDEFSALEPAQQQEARALLNVSSDRTKPPQQRAAAKMRLDAMLLEAGIIPVGEVTEADPLLPVGEAQELTATEATSQIVQPPDFEQRRAMGKRVPTGEATELTPEEIELETIPQPDVIEAGGDLPLPEGMAPRTPKQPEPAPAKPMTDADIVAAVVDGFRKTNTPQARAFVQDFDAGRIKPADVLQLVGRPPQSPDERLAAAAAQAPKKTDIQPGDILTVDGQPFGTRSGAYVRAKKEGGEVVSVSGGWAVRPKESAREQPDVAGATSGPLGARDGGSPPAAPGGGNLRPDADGTAGVDRGGPTTAPRSGGGAAVAVVSGDRPDAPLTVLQLKRAWSDAVNRGDTEAAREINDRIVAAKARNTSPRPNETPQTAVAQSDSGRNDGSASNIEPATLPDKIRAKNAETAAAAPVAESLAPGRAADGEVGVAPGQGGSSTAPDQPKTLKERREAANEREPFEHAGLKVYPGRVRVGDQIEDRWAVQLPENKGTNKVLGDTLHATREEAMKAAEREVARFEREQRNRAEQDAAEAARKAEEDARKAANRGKSLVERRADATLDRETSENGERMTRRQWVDRKVAEGLTPRITQEDKIKPLTRAQFNRATGEEQRAHERKVKAAGTKEVYWIGDYEVTKTEYEYAKSRATAAAQPAPTDDAIDPFTLDKAALNRRLDQIVAADEAPDLTRAFMVLRKRYMAATGKPSIPPAGSRAVPMYPEGAAPATAQQVPPAEATHKDPGEPAEPVTAEVVAEVIEKAAKNTDRSRSEMKAEALRLIDAAMVDAKGEDDPDVRTYEERSRAKVDKKALDRRGLTGVMRQKAEEEIERRIQDDVNKAVERIGYVTIKVPGDGAFKVFNTKDRLAEFRRKIEQSPGFKDRQTPTASARTGLYEVAFGVESGSGSKLAAFSNMVDEGDIQAALDYAEAVGIDPKTAKLADVLRKRLDKWMRDQEMGAAVAAREAVAPPTPEPEPEPQAAEPEAPGLDLMGFERIPKGNGAFELRDSNMRVSVEPTERGKYRASMGSAKSGPNLSEQMAVEWAAAYRAESLRVQAADAKKAATPAPQAAEPEAAPDDDAPQVTEAQARKQFEWRDLGQKDGTKTHGLFFYVKPEDKGTGRAMGRGQVTRYEGANGWQVDSEGQKYPALADAKKAAIDAAIPVLREQGWIADAPTPTTDPFSADYAALVGKTIEQTVTTDDGKTAKLRMDAARALRDFDQRQKTLQDLKACLGRNG